MGSDMSQAPKTIKGNISQDYLTQNYPNWRLNISSWKDREGKTHSFEGYLNNDLMYNINPEGENGAKAISQNPLNMVLLFSQQQSNPADGANPVTNRINPFLAEDINSYFKNTNFTGPMSDYASSSKYHQDSQYYTDLRTQTIKSTNLLDEDNVEKDEETAIGWAGFAANNRLFQEIINLGGSLIGKLEDIVNERN